MTRTSTENPDELLVIEAILGSFDAFDELALRYRAAVVRTAQGIVGRDDAEDVAQDALLLAFKALPSIEDPTKFAAWLSAITRHRALRFNKRESAHKQGRIELDELLLEQLGALRLRRIAQRRGGATARVRSHLPYPPKRKQNEAPPTGESFTNRLPNQDL